MGIGDWGLGIGDWGLGPIPNPQSPIPIYFYFEILKKEKYNCFIILLYYILLKNKIYFLGLGGVIPLLFP